MSLASVCGADVMLLARTETGELEFWNSGGATEELSFYTIESLGESLLPDDWTPISGRLDLAGGGAFDGNADWVVFQPSISEGELTEGAFSGPGGALAPGETVSIGPAWDPLIAQDLTVTAVVGNVSDSLQVIYTPVGDYDWDGDVDVADFEVFSQTFGSTTDKRADGNGDGIVDISDYSVWRDAFTAASPSQPLVLSFASAPEPASALLFALGAALVSALRRR